MVSMADGFANGAASISGGFDGQILGQASYINRLQQNGVATANGQSGGSRAARIVQALNRFPHLVPQAIAQMQNNPRLIAQALTALQREPHLIGHVPPAIQRFLAQAVAGRTG